MLLIFVRCGFSCLHLRNLSSPPQVRVKLAPLPPHYQTVVHHVMRGNHLLPFDIAKIHHTNDSVLAHHGLPPMDTDPAQGLLPGINRTFLALCDVYGLQAGTFKAKQALFGTVLPGYFVTNCLMDTMKHYFAQSNITKASQVLAMGYLGYNQVGNGDTFVALLFTILGACALAWMLTLLLVLSPPQKRKPLIAQVATLFFAITMTILVCRVTDGASREYYQDRLDMYQIHQVLYNNTAYRICVTISQFITEIAYLEIMTVLLPRMARFPILIFMVAVVLARLAVLIVYEARFDNSQLVFITHVGSTAETFKIVRVVLMVVIILGFWGLLLYYTWRTKSPRKVSYCRKLLPLGLFINVIFGTHVVLLLLIVTLFREKWLPLTWLVFLPYLIEVVLITMVWEWIFNIALVEKRNELIGVLGRRILVDDAVSLSLNIHRKRTYSIYKDGKLFFKNGIFGSKHIVTKDDSDHSKLLSSDNGVELDTLQPGDTSFEAATTTAATTAVDTASATVHRHQTMETEPAPPQHPVPVNVTSQFAVLNPPSSDQLLEEAIASDLEHEVVIGDYTYFDSDTDDSLYGPADTSNQR